MNDMKINESQVFDACALIEEIANMSNVEAIKVKAHCAAVLLNKALEEGEKV